MQRLSVPAHTQTAVLTQTEKREQVRTTGATDDALLDMAELAAIHEAEQIMGRSIIVQDWLCAQDGFPSCGTLKIQAPGASVQSVKYLDTAGVQQTLPGTDYTADTRDEYWTRITLKPGKSWPATYPQDGAVEIAFKCGWANAAAVPNNIKQWLRLRMAGYYMNREAITAVVPLHRNEFVDRLLDRWVVPRW